VKKETASTKSVQEFRDAVAASLGAGGAVLINLIDVLATGPRPASPVELTLSAMFAYDWSSLYQALRRAEGQLAETIGEDDWLRRLRAARLNWLQAHPQPRRREELGPWRVRILDASNYDRPKTRTVEVGYVHGANGMNPGHGLSLLGERVGEGSWTLPLEIAWFSPQSDPLNFGVAQLEEFAKQHGWSQDQVLTVDAQYTVAPFLKPVHELGVPILGRTRSNRCFYLPPPEYSGFGRPAVRGRKIKLNDAGTLPPIDVQDEWELEDGGRVEVSRWDDVRIRQWLAQRLVLYRVIEYKADGGRRYKRPLWLIFVPRTSQAEAPAPRQAEAIYDERFSIEHGIRFLRGELGATCGQFNGEAAEGRLQVWVEMVATAFWLLWVLREQAKADAVKLPGWWRSGKLTPGAVRRMAAGLLMGLGWSKPQPKPRGKSPGRVTGTTLKPRMRFRFYRRTA
jgi:hypothetical protein